MSAASMDYRNTGLKYSGALHAALILIAIIGLPKWFHRNEDFEPTVMTVEILPFAPKSNVRPQQEAPKQKPNEKTQPPESRKPVPETHKAEASHPELVPSPNAKPLKPLKPNKPKTKEEEDLEKILQSVKNTAKAEEKQKPKQSNPTEAKAAKAEHFDPSAPLSISEKDAIRNQFIQCWNVPAGAKDAQDLVVVLRVALAEDGNVTNVELAQDESRYNTDTFFRAAADSAMRAVHLCSPLKNLPSDKYGAWHDMELTFDPKEML